MSAVVQSTGGNTGTNAAPGASITVAFTGNTTSGNTALLLVSCDNIVSTPAGWTLDKSSVFNNGHYVFRKAATGTNMSASMAITGSGFPTSWQLIEIVGTPSLGFSSTTGASSSATTATATAITPTAGSPFIVIGTLGSSKSVTPAALFNTSTTASFISAAPDEATTIVQVATNIGLVTYYRDIASASGTYSFAGTVGAGGNAAWTGMMVAYAQTGGVTNFNGSASASETATATAAGATGLSTGASASETASATATGATGVSRGASTTTVSASAAASGGGAGQATETVTATASAAGVLGLVGSASQTATATATAAGTVATSTGASVTETVAATAAGSVGKFGTASASITVGATAAGGGAGQATQTVTAAATAAGASGLGGAASQTITAGATAGGFVARSAGASVTETATATAAGSTGLTGGASQTVTASASAAGSVSATATPVNSTNGNSTTQNPVITIPSGYAVGDAMFLLIERNNQSTSFTPSGLTGTVTQIVNVDTGRHTWFLVQPSSTGQTSFTMGTSASAVNGWYLGNWGSGYDLTATIPSAGNPVGSTTVSLVAVPETQMPFIATGHELQISSAGVNATATWTTDANTVYNTSGAGNAAIMVDASRPAAGSLTAVYASLDRGNSGSTRNQDSASFVVQATPVGVVNLLTNPSFETFSAGLATSWTDEHTTAGAATYTSTASNVTDGTTAQRIQYTGQAGDAAGTAILEIFQAPIAATPGQVLTFSVYLSGSVNTDAIIGIEAFTSGNAYISEHDTAIGVSVLTGTPTLYTVTYTCPAGTDHVAAYYQIDDIATATSIDVTLDKATLTLSSGLSGSASASVTATPSATGQLGVNTGASATETASATATGSTGLSGSATTTTVTAAATATGATGLATGASATETATRTAAGVVGLSTGASASETASATASGSAGLSTGASQSITAAATAAGQVATSGSASATETAAATASGATGLSTGASQTVTAGASAAGSVTSGLSGGGSLTVTAAATSSGNVATSAGASATETATATASGVAASSTGASETVTASATAAGVVGLSTGATETVTASPTAAGVKGVNTGASQTVTAGATAAGTVTVGLSGGGTLTTNATATAAGVVATSTGATGTITAGATAAGAAGRSGGGSLTTTASATAAGIVTGGQRTITVVVGPCAIPYQPGPAIRSVYNATTAVVDHATGPAVIALIYGG